MSAKISKENKKREEKVIVYFDVVVERSKCLG